MEVRYSPDAVAALRLLPSRVADQILRKVRRLEGGMMGNIKSLSGFKYGYRLRSGDYRVLFDIEGGVVIIQDIKHRKEAYD